ncbi:MAG: hypothetical protein U9O53_03960 [archaeon]|nr:hypothetical protein [archaeon]
MSSDILVPDEERLETLKKKMVQAGPGTIHVVTDFDRTLTKAFVNGKKIPSLISVLRNGNYLTSDYAERAHELFNKYHPIEIDTGISEDGKKKAMFSWWREHFDLLIKSGLNKKDIEDAVGSGDICIRSGLPDFLDILNKHRIPLAIISSNGLGGDSISMYLKRKNLAYGNVHVISNSYIWDENGNAVGVKEPIIHSANKDETVIRETPVFGLLKNRKNVILLGDSIEDIKMVSGFDYDNIIKIGFLNETSEKSIDMFRRSFDVIILNDSGMGYVNSLLGDILDKY